MRAGSMFPLCLFLLAFAPVSIRAESQASRVDASSALSPATRRFDGTDSAAPAGLPAWQQALFELRRADPRWPDGIAITRRALEQSGPEVVPIGVIDLRGPAPLFVVTTLRTVTYRGADLVVTLDRERWVSVSPLPRWITIDCDDGLGARVMHFGERLPVHYATVGTRTLRLRAVDASGFAREGRFRLRVEALETPVPDDTLRVTGTTPYAGGVASGRGYVYLAPGHTRMVQPIVMVEGFDLANNQNWDELYQYLNRESLVERMRARGYDLVVLDFTDATDYIERNAFVLVDLLRVIRGRLGSADPVSLVGASTGGVIARYALLWMESHGIPHGVKTFLTLDAPHLGANVPLGIQYWFRFFGDVASQAAFFAALLDRPAAREILLYHSMPTPLLQPAPDALRASLLADLAAMGDWPRLPRKVAIANGSGAGVGQGFAPGDPLLRYGYRSGIRSTESTVWALRDQAVGQVFEGRITVLVTLRRQSVLAAGAPPLDGAPGGWRATMLQMDTTAVPYGDIVALHPRHCFVPTASALALDVPRLDTPLPSGPALRAITPFDAVYAPAENQEHVLVTAENATWIEREIANEVAPAVTGVATFASNDDGLARPAPNPFRTQTRIGFRLAVAQHVRVAVYDPNGRVVATLLDAPLAAGEHSVSWTGASNTGRLSPPGLYFVRLETPGRTTHVRITRLE